jgi:hypothetical protein
VCSGVVLFVLLSFVLLFIWLFFGVWFPFGFLSLRIGLLWLVSFCLPPRGLFSFHFVVVLLVLSFIASFLFGVFRFLAVSALVGLCRLVYPYLFCAFCFPLLVFAV